MGQTPTKRKGQKNMSKESTRNVASEGTHILPVSAIDVDRNWNSRNKYGAKHEGDDWKVFVDSFDRGQDTPIIVMPHPDAKAAEKTPYFLVSGHRRLEAVASRTETPGLKPGHIRAEIRPMTWARAREVNIRENSAREGISAADTVWAVSQFRKALKSENVDMGQVQMAMALGFQQGYISRILSVDNALDGSDLTTWRNSQKAVTLREVEAVCKAHKDDAAKEERKKAFAKLFAGSSNGNGETSGSGGKDWLAKGKARASALGETLARLEFHGFVEVDRGVFTKKNLHHFMSASDFTDHAEKSSASKILDAGKAAYENKKAAMKKEADDAAAAEEAARKAEAAKAAKAAKKGKEGAGASAN